MFLDSQCWVSKPGEEPAHLKCDDEGSFTDLTIQGVLVAPFLID